MGSFNQNVLSLWKDKYSFLMSVLWSLVVLVMDHGSVQGKF